MRIVQLANFVAPHSGGLKTVLDALGKGYVEAGVQRLLIVPGPTDAATSTPEGDVMQFRAPKIAGGYRMIVEPWRVIEVLKRFRPTSVELSDKLTLLPVGQWAKRTGVRSVLFSHERLDHMWASYTGLDTAATLSIRLLDRMLVRSFDTIVVTSGYAQQEFQTLADAVGCPVERVRLGVDLETFRPRPGSPADEPHWTPQVGGSPGAGRGTLRLVHAGRLSREKSPDLAVATAVELWRRGVDVRLDVYGDGPQLVELVRLAGDAPVHFHGHVGGRDELGRGIRAADVALSVCPEETFGLAVLEALASGTPVVTASRGGARELIDAGSGAWGDPDPVSLADAVLEVAGRPVDERRSAARRRAELYPWSSTVQRMLQIHALAPSPLGVSSSG